MVLAPKTIDNDLGLNHRNEPDEWERVPCRRAPGYRYQLGRSSTRFSLDGMVNYVTPGFATAVYVSVEGVQRVRTTAESHRRIAHRRGHGPALRAHRPRRRLRPARHHPRARGPGEHPRPRRAGGGALRAAEERGHRLRRGHRGRGRPGAGGDARVPRPRRQRHPLRRLRGAARPSSSTTSATPTSATTGGRSRPGPRSSPGRSATPSAAGGRCSSTASTPASSAARRWTCSSRAGTTPWPSSSGTTSGASTSTATTATRFRDRWGIIHPRFLHPSFYDQELMRPSQIARRVPAADLHQRDRPRRHRGHPPDGVRLRQPLPPVPLGQHRHQQADPVPEEPE